MGLLLGGGIPPPASRLREAVARCANPGGSPLEDRIAAGEDIKNSLVKEIKKEIEAVKRLLGM